MRKHVLFLSALFILGTSMKSDKPAYLVFNQKGKTVEYQDILKAALESDIIFLASCTTLLSATGLNSN